MPCTSDQTGEIRCECNAGGGLIKYQCNGTEWVMMTDATGAAVPCVCEGYDIPCYIQDALAQAGYCIEWAWALAILAGGGMLVFALILAR